MAITDVPIPANDVDDIRGVLQASLVYFQAEDLQRAQINFSANNPSQLTIELQRVLTRLGNFYGDFLISQREAELDDEEYEEEVDDEETEEEEVDEDQELSANPLGTAKTKRQQGRRLTAEEVRAE